ncbi:MAG: cation:proton antiporter, partial [Acidimicrobiia bacterium]
MTGPFTAASHHDVLVLLIQIGVLLLAARGLGEVSQRLGQPAVVGEILAGIVLGPSLLSSIVPGLAEWIVPQTQVQGYLLEVVALLGAVLLLLITGLETDIALIRRHARTALSVSWGGIFVTFTTGFALGWLLPDFLLADPDQRLVFALFVATAMSISAIPVIAKVLMDMNLMRRDIGQTILAAGMSDDTTGWIVLGIVAGLAGAGTLSALGVAQTIASVVTFLVLSLTVGRFLVKRLLDVVQDEVVSRDRLLTLVVVLTFAWGAITHRLGLEPVLGAFVMGIIFGQMRRLPVEVHQRLESITLGVFAPIFFAVAGLKVDVVSLLEPTLLGLAVLVILVATAGKVIGTYIGSRVFAGKDHWTALAFGAGLNARGAMEIIIATIGLSLGILSQDMFSMIVLMAMVTSLMAPFGLRFVLRRITPEEQELKRLRREELTKDSLVAGIHRVLLPVRARSDLTTDLQTIQARIMDRLGADGALSVTLLSAAAPGEKSNALSHLDRVAELFESRKVVSKKVVEGREPADAILDEAQKHYDLVVLGASDRNSNSEVLFNPLVDFVVRVSPCPTMVVHGQSSREWALRRILVPTDGTTASRRAAELAFAVATEDTRVTIVNIVVEERSPLQVTVEYEGLSGRLAIAHQLVDELREMGESLGVETAADVRFGPDAETVILDMAESTDVDLVILGTDIRPGSDRLYL